MVSNSLYSFLALKKHFSLIFLSSLCLFSSIVDIGSSFGVGINVSPFSRTVVSVCVGVTCERFITKLLVCFSLQDVSLLLFSLNDSGSSG